MAGHREYIRLPESKPQLKQRLLNLGIFDLPAEKSLRKLIGERVGASSGDKWWLERMTILSKGHCMEMFGWDGEGPKPDNYQAPEDFDLDKLLALCTTAPTAADGKPAQGKTLPNGIPLIDRSAFKGKKRVSFLQEIEWVRQHYMLKDVQVQDAPTPWAWSQICEIQKDPMALRTFTEQFVVKLNPTKKEQEDAEKRHGGVDETGAYMQRLKQAFCDATGQDMPSAAPVVQVLDEGEL